MPEFATGGIVGPANPDDDTILALLSHGCGYLYAHDWPHDIAHEGLLKCIKDQEP